MKLQNLFLDNQIAKNELEPRPLLLNLTLIDIFYLLLATRTNGPITSILHFFLFLSFSSFIELLSLASNRWQTWLYDDDECVSEWMSEWVREMSLVNDWD